MDNQVVEISRGYMKFLTLLAQVGGIMKFLTLAITILYISYNSLMLDRYIFHNTIVGGDITRKFSEEYNLKRNFMKVYYYWYIWLCCKKDEKIEKYDQKILNMQAAGMIVSQKMELNSYIRDSLDFGIIRQ